MKLTIGFFSAAITPALLVTIWYLSGQIKIFGINDDYIWVRTSGILSWCIIISCAHVLALGVPFYFIVRRYLEFRIWTTIIGGLLIGVAPVAIYTWPLRYPSLKVSSTSNGVQTMIDGIPTLAGWIEYISFTSFFGLLGSVGALVFWFVVAPSKMNRQEDP